MRIAVLKDATAGIHTVGVSHVRTIHYITVGPQVINVPRLGHLWGHKHRPLLQLSDRATSGWICLSTMGFTICEQGLLSVLVESEICKENKNKP